MKGFIYQMYMIYFIKNKNNGKITRACLFFPFVGVTFLTKFSQAAIMLMRMSKKGTHSCPRASLQYLTDWLAGILF